MSREIQVHFAMPIIEITVPRLGWSMEEGIFAGWLKSDGDIVSPGDLIFTLEGEKATQEVECLDAGTLRFLPDGPRPGDTVQVGQVLAHLLSASSSVESMPPEHPSTLPPPDPSSAPARVISSTAPTQASTPARATPRARRLARDRGLDPSLLTGSGRGGRVRERDILAAAGSIPPSEEACPTLRPHSAVRRAIAHRLLTSHQTTAPVTITTTADATNLVSLRSQFQAAARLGDSIVPSFNDFLLKLTALALRDHPEFNSRYEDHGLSLLPDLHLALAVDTPGGLLAPVLHHVDRLPLRELAARSRQLIQAARGARLSESDLAAATFTLTSLGSLGVDAFTPIINPPQAAILGIGRIHKQAVYIDHQFVPRDLLTLSLTFDHRVADGGPAARFLQTIRLGVENPAERLID